MSTENPTIDSFISPEINEDTPPEVKLKIILKLRPDLKNEIKNEVLGLVKANAREIKETVPVIAGQAMMSLILWALKDAGYLDANLLSQETGLELPELMAQANFLVALTMISSRKLSEKISTVISRFSDESK